MFNKVKITIDIIKQCPGDGVPRGESEKGEEVPHASGRNA
jgi:hypothetical protein